MEELVVTRNSEEFIELTHELGEALFKKSAKSLADVNNKAIELRKNGKITNGEAQWIVDYCSRAFEEMGIMILHLKED